MEEETELIAKKDNSAKTILIVDDDPVTLQSLQRSLSASGYAVVTHRDGRSALIAVHDGLRVDLVITNYRMPGMDGLDLISRLKQYLPLIPAIMCSVYVRTDVYLKALGLGVVEYLEKPLREENLKRVIALALGVPQPESGPAPERKAENRP